MLDRIGTWGLGALALAVALVVAPAVHAQPFFKGAGTCQECHKAEHGVWEGTQHFKSFREIHRHEKARDIAEAAGGDRNMRRNDTCVMCHYTMAQEDAGAAPSADSGPSCESCHGASSDWVKIHNDYGGRDVKREDETPEHRAQRIAAAAAAGMIWPHELYDVAMNCMSCHGLANPNLDGGTLSAMLNAGHPINPDFELVAYSQGSVRHRFYPPDVTVNQEMTPAELSRMFVVGQAAKLVSATGAAGKSDDPKFVEAQRKRAEDAAAALSLLSAPEAAALVSAPSDANARALVRAIEGQDLTAEVGSALPPRSAYK